MSEVQRKPGGEQDGGAIVDDIQRRLTQVKRYRQDGNEAKARSISAGSIPVWAKVRDLAKQGLTAHAIHGNKSQGQRERVLAAFREGKVRTLVATDIAARGIDVEGISHVVNYDLPNIPESYVHRIGRTARAGADGVAISFCDGEERAYLRDIEKLIRMSIPAEGQHGAPRPQPQRSNGQANAGPRGRHGSHRNGSQQARRSHAGKPAHRQGHREQPPREQEHRAQPVAASDGSIASVAFLQHKPDPRRPNDARRPVR